MKISVDLLLVLLDPLYLQILYRCAAHVFLQFTHGLVKTVRHRTYLGS